MDIQDIRRSNLRRWADAHGVPSKEKSYFSQLLGGASFGERAARRLESAYGMGERYLDQPLPDVNPATKPASELSPSALALTNAICDADQAGISPDVFDAMREMLRLYRRDSARQQPGRFDVENPSQ
ncbi:hypothetical protein LGM79_09955 [Burkholderia multivorans]|nr:hypothetical protein [Burkholderia multivorans]MDN7985658.1 hypothetical protein [Burkholderia multivorans]